MTVDTKRQYRTRADVTVVLLAVALALAGGCHKRPASATPATPGAAHIGPGSPEFHVAAAAAFMPPDDDSSTYLFDAVKAGTNAPSAAFAARTAWRQVPEDTMAHAFAGAAVAQNNRVALWARPGAEGVVLLALGGAAPQVRALLSPAGGGKVGAIAITENTTSGVRLDVRFIGGTADAGLAFRLAPGDAVVEMQPLAGAGALRVVARARHAIIPSFFDNDMVFVPGSLDRDRILLPIEQMLLLPVADGASIIMCVCETDRQDATIAFAGTGADRAIVAADMAALPGKKIWVALLEKPHAWHAPGLRGGVVWEPPFPARWRLDLLRETGTAESLDFTALRLQQVEHHPFVVYPLERDRTTPFREFCMRDIMKATLGVGPCEYILQSEGLTNACTPDEVANWLTKQIEKGKAAASGPELNAMLKQMAEHVAQAQSRIDAYGVLAATLRENLRDVGRVSPEAVVRMAGVTPTLELIARLADQGAKTRRQKAVEDLSRRLRDALSEADVAALVRKAADELRSLGHEQDRAITRCRLAQRWLRQQFRMGAEDRPVAAEAIAKLVRIVESCAAAQEKKP